jgi:hypothetical protein
MVVKLTFDDNRDIQVETWDISDGGIGIHIPNHQDVVWTIGTQVHAQVQGLPIEGPILPMKVVRISDDRIGLKML